MSKATSPTHRLRCIACGYDVGPVIDERGREEPGVCPECGADLTYVVYLSQRPGTAWQRTHALSGLVRFNLDSIRNPRQVAASVRFPDRRIGGAWLWNAFVGAAFSLLLPTIPAIATGSAEMFISSVMLTVVGCIPLMVVLMIAVLFMNAIAQVVAKARGWTINDRLGEAACDIGSAWVAAMPFVGWTAYTIVLVASPVSYVAAAAALALVCVGACAGALYAMITALSELRDALAIPFRAPHTPMPE